MIRQIDLNGKNVNYEYQQKEVKNINLRIKSDKSVIVSPTLTSLILLIEAVKNPTSPETNFSTSNLLGGVIPSETTS